MFIILVNLYFPIVIFISKHDVFLFINNNNTATYGDTSVCSESDLGLGRCSGGLNYEQAKLFCTSKYRDRGRMCTRAELINDEAQDAACGYEADLTWTSEPCGPSDVWAYDGTTTSCENLWTRLKVRCCADQVLYR